MDWLGFFILFLILIIIYLIVKREYYSYDIQNDIQNDNNARQHYDNTQITQKNNDKNTLGIYYTEWCGYSRHFLSDYKSMESDIKKLVNVDIVDCDKEPEKCRKNNVQGFPTLILHMKDKDIIYNGNRSQNDLIDFLNKNK
jgi:thiol-disulfide isomerase/thioredoxin